MNQWILFSKSNLLKLVCLRCWTEEIIGDGSNSFLGFTGVIGEVTVPLWKLPVTGNLPCERISGLLPKDDLKEVRGIFVKGAL